MNCEFLAVKKLKMSFIGKTVFLFFCKVITQMYSGDMIYVTVFCSYCIYILFVFQPSQLDTIRKTM